MKKIIKYMISCALGFMVSMNVAASEERGSQEEAVAMVKKAVEHLNKVGKEKAFEDFADQSNKVFHDRDLYIFVYDMNGVSVAHGNNPKLVGRNLLEMKDNEGKYLIKEFVQVAKTKGSGWVNYKWPNPVTKAVELKSGYIEKVGDLIVGSGVYLKAK